MNQSDQRDKKNPKIGRPAKTTQQQQFKAHYLANKKKFELECQLLVCIHQTYFDQIPCNPINRRVPINNLTFLFQTYKCVPLYQILLKVNQKYFKNSSLFPQQKLRYTSIIDISYLTKQVKKSLGDKLRSTQLMLIVIFFLYNQKLVNKEFYEYFNKQFDFLRRAMIEGPKGLSMTKLDVLIVTLGIQLAVLEQIKIIDDRNPL